MSNYPWINYNTKRGAFVHTLLNTGYHSYKLARDYRKLVPYLNPIKQSAYQAASLRDNYKGMPPAKQRQPIKAASKNARTPQAMRNYKSNSTVKAYPRRLFIQRPFLRPTGGKGGKWSGVSGPVNKFRKTTKKEANFDKEYLRYGAHIAQETSGTVTDPNAVYIGHTTVPLQMTGRVIAMACIRKLWQQAGMDVTNPQELLYGSLQNTVALLMKNASTGLITVGWTFSDVGGYSLEQIGSSMDTYLKTVYNPNAAVSSDLVPLRLQLQKGNDTGLADIDLTQLSVHVKCYSRMKIQNRTATAVGDEADDVDNQPLQGRIYDMNGPIPIVRTSDQVAFPIPQTEGVVLAVAGSSNLLRDPPHPKTLGAKKAANVRITPGELKYSSLSANMKLTVNTYYKLQAGQSGLSNVRSRIGNCRLYAFEKMIQVGANNVLVAYETEFDLKAYCTFNKRPFIRKLNYNYTVST